MKLIPFLLACLSLFMGQPVGAQEARWGVFAEMAKRQWVTEGEPRPRATRFQWEVPGRVLVARHGFVSRLSWGIDKFADTVQRLELKSTGIIESTYTYEDRRPPLRTTIRIESDGSAVETFVDAKGVEIRNTYRSPTRSVNLIERERLQGGQWARLGTTRKAGLTSEEIAENERKAEDAHRLAELEQRARQAEMEAQIAAEQSYASTEEPSAPMGSVFLQELQGMAAQEQAEARRATQRTNQMIANAQAQEAARRVREARDEANRIAAENSRRVQEANARQAAIAAQSAQPNPASRVDAQPAGPQGDAERARRDQEFAESQRRLAEQKRANEEALQRAAYERADQIEVERKRREAEVVRQKQAEDQRIAEQRRKDEEARRPVAFREGVTLCQKNRGSEWRCDGPLQVTYGNIDASRSAINEACGASTWRELGVVSGYRAFGCGFGIHPTLRNYPGNRDVPAMLGIYVPSRANFYCPRSTSAYCRGQ